MLWSPRKSHDVDPDVPSSGNGDTEQVCLFVVHVSRIKELQDAKSLNGLQQLHNSSYQKKITNFVRINS